MRSTFPFDGFWSLPQPRAPLRHSRGWFSGRLATEERDWIASMPTSRGTFVKNNGGLAAVGDLANQHDSALANVQRLEGELVRARQSLVALRVRLQKEILPADDLTARQREVLTLIYEGKSNKEIAAALCITVRTAKFHVSKLLAVFDRENRHELAVLH
jgi:DNA-binding CsgD family transcriptional regulator